MTNPAPTPEPNRKKELRASLLEKVDAGTPETIHSISRQTKDVVVLRAIARNEMTAALTLKLLSTMNNKSVRQRVAENKNTPYGTLKMLEDMGYEIPEPVLDHAARIELAQRRGIEEAQDLPGFFLQELLKDL